MQSSSRVADSDRSPSGSPSDSSFALSMSTPAPTSPIGLGPSSPFRPRSKTLASLTILSRNHNADLTPQEVQLPDEPLIFGRPLLAVLYKEAIDCPICFLAYPPYLNKTRCCDQPICSECFVQIKRPDPHPPEHADPSEAISESNPASDGEYSLVSEPAACPFCKQPEFGVTYDPPPFRRGLVYSHQTQPHPLAHVTSAMSSTSSVSSTPPGTLSPGHGHRRTTSLSANAPTVITTDKIRPDWSQKLATARAHSARRAAAATALHTAAYMMGPNGGEGRLFAFGRRGIMRRVGGEPVPSNSRSADSHSPMGDRNNGQSGSLQGQRGGQGGDGNHGSAGSGGLFSRRSRVVDLEEMMMMEAIRLSIADEEERRKKAEAEEKKEEKEKSRIQPVQPVQLASNSGTSHTPDVWPGPNSRPVISPVSTTADDGKGKHVERQASPAGLRTISPIRGIDPSQSPIRLPYMSNESSPNMSPVSPSSVLPSSLLEPLPTVSAETNRAAHLRQLSGASSSASSLVDPSDGRSGSIDQATNNSSLALRLGNSSRDTIDSARPATPSSAEPMFNFQSLTAMISDEEEQVRSTEKTETTHTEDSAHEPTSAQQSEKTKEPKKEVSSEKNGDSLADTSNSTQSNDHNDFRKGKAVSTVHQSSASISETGAK
jgi:hypothetical protein